MSSKVLEDARDALKNGDVEYADEYITHIDNAIASRDADAALVVPRTLTSASKSLGSAPYVEESPILSTLTKMNCHIGQRKLALALIEFMNICADVHSTIDFFVVYPGSSIMACLAAAELYPTARFLCYDPAFDATVTNVKRELGHRADTILRNVEVIRAAEADKDVAIDAFNNLYKNIVVFTDEAGMYGDESHKLVKDVHKGVMKHDSRKREIIFCSDVRMDPPEPKADEKTISKTVTKSSDKKSVGGTLNPSELQIAQEMTAQAVWVSNLDVKCFVLKFRMPFGHDDELEKLYEGLYKKLKLKNPAAAKGSDVAYPYLDGECYIQLYAREVSAELRLIGTEGAKMKRYSLKEIEETMAAFNTVHRAHTCFKFSEGHEVPEGFMDLVKKELSPQSLPCLSYDALCEAGIIHRALVLSGGPRDSISLRNKMNAFSGLYSSGRHPQTCSVKKFDGPRKPNQNRKVFGKFDKKTFPSKKPFQMKAPAKAVAFTPAFIGGSRDYELPLALEYPSYVHKVVNGGGYKYSYVIVPLAILGTFVASMLPR